MRIVYMGSGVLGIECLNALACSTHNINLIVTQPARKAGRGRKPRPTVVDCWAEEHGIPVEVMGNVNTPENIEIIADYEPDLIVVIAFGQKISRELTKLPPKGSINVHASLLPEYRGAAPVNWAIIKGETKTGISIITLADKMDAGQVISQAGTEIRSNETAGQLHDRLGVLAAPLLIETLDKIEAGDAIYTEQDHSKATLAPKLKKADGYLDFAEPAEILARKIRGLWPWPSASANYVSKESGKTIHVNIAMAKPVVTQNTERLPAGTLDKDLQVICGEDALKIAKIKPAGSHLMDFKDFTNGRHIQPGDSFAKISE